MYNKYFNSEKKKVNRKAIMRVMSILSQNGVMSHLATDEHRNDFIKIGCKTYAVSTNMPENADLGNFFITESEADNMLNFDCNGIILYHSGYDTLIRFETKSSLWNLVMNNLKWVHKKKKDDTKEELLIIDEDEETSKKKPRKAIKASILDCLELADKFGYMTV